jgi:hypothetical protein
MVVRILCLQGYAYSGGGRGIVRIDVSADGGKTWKTGDSKHASLVAVGIP